MGIVTGRAPADGVPRMAGPLGGKLRNCATSSMPLTNVAHHPGWPEQVADEHVLPSPCQAPSKNLQSFSEVSRQPSDRQHAPMGVGHSDSAHVEPAPRHRSHKLAQLSATVSTQEASGRQQAPRQTPTSHAVPAPSHSPPAVRHDSSVWRSQDPSLRQHAPVGAGGQDTWLQSVPGPTHVPRLPTQPASVRFAQV